MKDNQLQRVLVKGGILAPSELKYILKMCSDMGLQNISFGSRQDILFPPTENQDKVFDEYPNVSVEKVRNKRHNNIVCSYLTVDIFDKTPWISSSTFLYILGQLDLKNSLSINVVDPLQQVIPLFTGNLNFLASHHESYWYLYIKLEPWKHLQRYPVLIHTLDIGMVTEIIQEFCNEEATVENIFDTVIQHVDPSKNRTIDREPYLSSDLFPYYEGMHRMEGDSYWLGLYWRNNNYYINFLEAVADLCEECKIGNLCITPWKSIIIKKIHKKHKLKWEKLLGRFGINVRHSLLELNWHIPVNDQEALDLKKYIVRVFDQNDISTYGMTLGIYNETSKGFFTTISIKKNASPDLGNGIEIRPTYDILYVENFKPNGTKYHTYAKDVDRLELPKLLIELSRNFFEQLGEDEGRSPGSITQKKEEAISSHKVYQCQDCFSIYDPKVGEPMRDIPAGTPFQSLPGNYSCAVCGSEKGFFQVVEMRELTQ